MNGSARRALLVGGSSEVGLAIVRRQVGAPDDAAVTLAGRTSPRLKAAEAALSEDGYATHVLAYDAQWGTAAVTMLLAEARRRMGGLDLVVVAPGAPDDEATPHAGTSPQTPAEPRLQTLLLTHFTGPALVANAAVDLFAAQRHGTLVVAPSGAPGHGVRPTLGHRSAELGLGELVHGLAARARPYGVQCLVAAPTDPWGSAGPSWGPASPAGTASHTPARP